MAMKRVRAAAPMVLVAALSVAALGLAGCAPVEPPPRNTVTPTPLPSPTETGPPALPGPVQPAGEPRALVTGLDVPWSVVRLSSGSALISERETALVKEYTADGDVREVGTVPGVTPAGEGGLLGLAVDVDERWLYAYTTAASDNRVIRLPLTGVAGGLALGAPTDVVTGIPKSGNHNGGRIKFGPDGMLYITTGDATNGAVAQDVGSLAGKILRVTPEGAVPADNPFVDSSVYSYGHRNPQGIAWDDDGRLWASEFGQNTWDELNLITPGGNYGWPVVEGIADRDGFIDPVHQWATTDASPSGLLFLRDTLFMAALRGERLWAIYPGSESVDAVDWFRGDVGRLRDAVEGPDGSLWLLTNNTARGTPRDGDDKLLEVRLELLPAG
ncbi:PQQ-dependent sugar dehydrogenase [Salinibacterium sp. ZJ454]|uniref:PQQ-dependent sugar dehydrogenase n=1 Tax=Salinibacterium sp. ZJ454 TaxID=2708339 RepID=UPI00142133D8|nr:PQQ-dependent sugar dehydrogenase [Salinibacterium sp. ZJ454]